MRNLFFRAWDSIATNLVVGTIFYRNNNRTLQGISIHPLISLTLLLLEIKKAMSSQTKFSPAHFLTSNKPALESKPIVLLILNQPIIDVKVAAQSDDEASRDVFETLWNYCKSMFF